MHQINEHVLSEFRQNTPSSRPWTHGYRAILLHFIYLLCLPGLHTLIWKHRYSEDLTVQSSAVIVFFLILHKHQQTIKIPIYSINHVTKQQHNTHARKQSNPSWSGKSSIIFCVLGKKQNSRSWSQEVRSRGGLPFDHIDTVSAKIIMLSKVSGKSTRPIFCLCLKYSSAPDY